MRNLLGFLALPLLIGLSQSSLAQEKKDLPKITFTVETYCGTKRTITNYWEGDKLIRRDFYLIEKREYVCSKEGFLNWVEIPNAVPDLIWIDKNRNGGVDKGEIIKILNYKDK